MKTLPIIFFLSLLVGACTNIAEIELEKAKAPIKTEFFGGGITVTYDVSGNFKSLISTSTSKVTSTLPSAVEEAIKIATLKARRQIAEFIETEIKSDRFTSSVSDSLQESDTFEADNKSDNLNTIALKVRENITQKSSQILKGTFVKSEKHDTKKKQVIVVVVTGVDSLGTSNKLKKLMSK